MMCGSNYRMGIDIGGTFTDFVLVDDTTGDIKLHKCLTTPEDPSIGALAGIAELITSAGTSFDQVEKILHGTTLVTNAIIEPARHRSRSDHHGRLSRPAGDGHGATL